MIISFWWVVTCEMLVCENFWCRHLQHYLLIWSIYASKAGYFDIEIYFWRCQIRYSFLFCCLCGVQSLQVSEDPRSFIIEIGTEEMPPQDVINASEQVKFHFIWRNLTFLSLSLTHGHLWAARSCCTILTSQTP